MSEWFSGIKAKFILDFIADQRWKYITDGLKVTLEVTFLALILGLVLGAVIAVIRTTHDQLKEDQSKGFGSFLIKLAKKLTILMPSFSANSITFGISSTFNFVGTKWISEKIPSL